MKAPNFLITPVKYDMQQTDVDFKSYKRKCSESSQIVVTTIITIYERSLRFRLLLVKSTSLGRKIWLG